MILSCSVLFFCILSRIHQESINFAPTCCIPENPPEEMESRVAVLEKTVSVIQTSVEFLRKLAEEHTSELADIRQLVVKTEEIKLLMEVSKSMQTQGLDENEESINDEEEKGEVGSISSDPKGEDVSNEFEERKDECLSQLKEENDMLRNKLKELAGQHALSEEQYAEKLKQKSIELELADLKIKQYEESLVQEQSQIKIYADQVSQLLATEKILRLQLTTEGEKIQQFEDVSNELEERKDECLSLQKENDMLKKELADLYAFSDKQYTLSEQYYADKLTLKQNSIELELADLKIKRLEEKLVQEQSQTKMYAEQVSELLETEKILRLQLTTDGKIQQFQDVSNELQERKDECLSLLKENDMLRNKLKELGDQHALSEEKYVEKLKQMSFELELADSKIKQHEEKLVQEQSQIKKYSEQVSQLEATEKMLQLELDIDCDRMKECQETLTQSRVILEAVEQQSEDMAKSIKELKEENQSWRRKSERAGASFLELLKERQTLNKKLEKTEKQKAALESLCRSLQAERRSLQAERKQSSSENKSDSSDQT